MRAGLLGQIVGPASKNPVIPGAEWVSDNGVFVGKYPGDEAYLAYLAAQPHKDRCAFAVAPDVVGDAEATRVRSLPMLARIRRLGVPVAYVAQNGATVDSLPWDAFDVLFIGGDTTWKLGRRSRALIAEAKRRSLRVHMGRVNSYGRLQRAADSGCDSADGTYLAFGPNTNLPRLLDWVRLANRPALFDAVGTSTTPAQE